MEITGLIILYIVFGFFAFCMLLAVGVMFYFYRRRKLIFTKFLSQNGQWEGKEWMPSQIEDKFEYDGEFYFFDIKKCTRDNLNRPVAHYYKGNPQQNIYPLHHGKVSIEIGTNQLTGKDFKQLMLSKVLKDIFSDDELMNWMIVLLVTNVVIGIILGIMIYKHNPPVILTADNETITTIVTGVKIALGRPV